MTGEADGCRDLAAYLTGTEARELALRLSAGHVMSAALGVVGAARRPHVRSLLTAAGLGQDRRDLTVSVLKAIEGGRSDQTSVGTVWTTPGGLSQTGQLTSMLHQYVSGARTSVVCSTYNFQRSSALWETLPLVAARGVAVRLYLDTGAADTQPEPWRPSTAEVATVMIGADVFRTRRLEGRTVRNHAKFVAIDHEALIVTSANFSKSAEQSNVELGVIIQDPVLTQSVESTISRLEESIYERVMAGA